MRDYSLESVLQYLADKRECRNLLRAGSRSFFAASLLLPREYRSPVTALYAFCRVADDAIDAGRGEADAIALLYRRLDAIYRDRPLDNAVDRAFTEVVHRYSIPYTLPAALLEGFEWDISGRRYESLSDVYGYAARVAGTVGAMMAIICGARRPDVLARACDLGVAMQLTNIARDVGEDARAGRLYLPGSNMQEAGIDVERWMQSPRFDSRLGNVVKQLLETADQLYQRSEWGIAQLPAACRPGIFAARWIYAEIGREVESNGLDSVSRRAIVGAPRKAILLAHALRQAVKTRQPDVAPPLDEVRFLLDAVAGA